jgi:hypothetical protein
MTTMNWMRRNLLSTAAALALAATTGAAQADDLEVLHGGTSVGKANTLLPSMAHGMAVSPAAEGAIKDVVSHFWNSDPISPAQTMDRLVAAAESQ